MELIGSKGGALGGGSAGDQLGVGSGSRVLWAGGEGW